MCNPAHFCTEYESSFVSEHPAVCQNRSPWADEEIAKIRAVLQRLTAKRIVNSNDVEDLVQETLLTMITKYPESGLKKGLLIWSLGILRRKVGNYYRRAQRCGRKACAAQQPPPFGRGSSPETHVFDEELQTIVEAALEKLPSSQRRAMELLVAGLDSGEVVRRLFPERYQNVINWLYRGRRKLAQELAKHGYGPHARIRMRSLRPRRP